MVELSRHGHPAPKRRIVNACYIVQGIELRCRSVPATYNESEDYASAGGLEEVSGTLNPVTGTWQACGKVVTVKVPLS